MSEGVYHIVHICLSESILISQATLIVCWDIKFINKSRLHS